jgi:hypothetical protein
VAEVPSELSLTLPDEIKIGKLYISGADKYTTIIYECTDEL